MAQKGGRITDPVLLGEDVVQPSTCPATDRGSHDFPLEDMRALAHAEQAVHLDRVIRREGFEWNFLLGTLPMEPRQFQLLHDERAIDMAVERTTPAGRLRQR